MLQPASDARRQLRHPFALCRGFTLQEMVVALCVGSVILAASVSIWSAVRRNTVIATANELLAQLTLARTVAIRRNVRVLVCPTQDRRSCLQPDGDFAFWQNGWLIYADNNGNAAPDDGEITRRQGAVLHGIVIRSTRSRRRVTYQPTGTSGGSTTTIAICDKDDPALARYIVISNGGRAHITRTTTSKVKCGT